MKIFDINCATAFYLTMLVLQAVTLALKLTGVSTMPWITVLMPLWGTAAMIILAVVMFLIETAAKGRRGD